jgi:hypothetical protein
MPVIQKVTIEDYIAAQPAFKDLDEEETAGLVEYYTELYPSGYMTVNTYTTHVILQEIIDHCAFEDNFAILFIDELNRCDHAVQQELMQLILEKRINDTNLPDNCAIIAAGNPDNENYQVLDMNDALRDRFVYVEMESDPEEWIKWALHEGEIHDEIINFIAEMPHMLHDPKAEGLVKPTPRSWDSLSTIYKNILQYYSNINDIERLLQNAANGLVGNVASNALLNFIRNKDNPLITNEEIFESAQNDFDEKIVPRAKKEKSIRLSITIDKAITYLVKHSENAEKKTANKMYQRFIDILKVSPKDMMVGVLSEIGNNHSKLHDRLTAYKNKNGDNEYMDIFFDTMQTVNAANSAF